MPDTNHRVLVVDDVEIDRELMKVYLEEIPGVEPILYEDTVQAYKYLKDNHQNLALVILDYEMPGIDGFDLLNSIRMKFKVPVIFVTALKEPGLEKKIMHHGAEYFFHKPLNKEEFIERIKTTLDAN
jgi:two-component system, OmpR family, response regulator VanR